MTDTSHIDALCRAVGVATGYTDAEGARHEATEAGKRLALEALGFPVSSAAQRAESAERAAQRARRPLPDLVTIEEGRPAYLPTQGASGGEWTVQTDSGETFGGRVSSGDGTLGLLPLRAGYHRLELPSHGKTYASTLIVAPRRCYLPTALASGTRWWGMTAQVYSLRGKHDLGIGTYADVEELGRAVGQRGGAFLGLSPVHALFGTDPSKYSPYSPSSRLFLQTSLIAPHAVPGFDPATDAPGYDIPPSALIDYPGVLSRQRQTLEAIWLRVRGTALQEISDFARSGGHRLLEHATFEALSEHLKAQGLAWLGEWPDAFRNVRSPDVETFRRDHSERIAFHIWLQWLADRQLAQASATAKANGMPIGLYRDLAVGADRGGSECWSAPEQFVNLSVGAPPDPLGPQGQDWGLPPLNPIVLAASGLSAFRELVAANMRHAGAIRIDHAFQLQRLFVMPVGGTAHDGVYLNYPFDALLAALKIESHRAQCLVIGEDLGTAPEGFSDKIMDAGILSYRLLPFERGEGGRFKEPTTYPARALAALSTHDLPTFAGWWRGSDTDVRECLGVFPAPRANRERRARPDERQQLARALIAEGFEAEPNDIDMPPSVSALRYLARTPSALVAVQLEDVLGEAQQANLPGPDCGHPNWRRRSSLSVQDVIRHPGLDRVAAAFHDEQRSTGPLPTFLNAPSATYRLQLHAKFTFDDAAATVPYLARLGVSHVYVSPVQMAQPGSTHGYDIVDPSRLNPELGGEEAFRRFSEALRTHRLRLMVDIVPNHVGVGGKHNPWWLDLLEWGRLSPYADAFDIDWEKSGSDGKLIVPFLGGLFEDLLAKRDIRLGFDATAGQIAVWYADHCHPVSPFDYAELLNGVIVKDDAGAKTLRALAKDFHDLRLWDKAQPDKVLARASLLRRRLAEACATHDRLRDAIERSAGSLGLDELRALCDRQSWRLVNWTEANEHINYRRFFDITSLAGVRIEDPRIFEASHRLIFDLVEEGLIHALRVDHVDGLADPAQYLARLQERVGPDFHIVVEKILEPGEHLPKWAVAGTTGYDALHTLDAVFFAREARSALDALAKDVVDDTPARALNLFEIKRDLTERTFISEFEGLRDDLLREMNMQSDDIAPALRALLAAFPVYRTYATTQGFSEQDRTALSEARRVALEKLEASQRPALDKIMAALERPGRALRRFQQLTGPLMAKSFEDTLFYRDTRFIAANEVGCGPDHPGIDVAEFHRANAERLADWPSSLIATSTHDTKRGEDARGRLLAASHRPEAWEFAWRRFRDANGADALAPADVYFLFQSLIAACPVSPTEQESAGFAKRAGAFVEKFLREGKLRSTWISPDTDYEKQVRAFVEQCASAQGVLFKDLSSFVRALDLAAGRFAIVRTVLKCTIPGIPDIYQGSELIDLSLVDPDNRRPVDYSAREALVTRGTDPGDEDAIRSGGAKFFVLTRLLHDRKTHPATYRGAYTPIATGNERIIAYMRGEGADALLIIGERGFDTGTDSATGWEIAPPEGQWRNLFDGRTLQGGRTLAGSEILSSWPAAALRKV